MPALNSNAVPNPIEKKMIQNKKKLTEGLNDAIAVFVYSKNCIILMYKPSACINVFYQLLKLLTQCIKFSMTYLFFQTPHGLHFWFKMLQRSMHTMESKPTSFDRP